MIFRGPKFTEMATWIRENLPELDAELGPLTFSQVRNRLNELTGLEVMDSDLIEVGSEKFLKALKEKHEEIKRRLR